MSYFYSLVRFVPNPFAGEFVNIGVLVGNSTTSDWHLNAEQLTRAKMLGATQDDLKVFKHCLAELRERIRRITESPLAPESLQDSLAWFAQVQREFCNTIQLAEPVPISAKDSRTAVAMVIKNCLPTVKRAGTTRSTLSAKVNATIRRAYELQGLTANSQLIEKSAVLVGTYTSDFDFAVRNGKVVQLTKSWTFEVKDQSILSARIKAWAWMVKTVRESGGELVLPTEGRIQIPSRVDVQAVIAPPKGDITAYAYAEVLTACKDLMVEPTPVDHAEAVGAKARQLLAAGRK